MSQDRSKGYTVTTNAAGEEVYSFTYKDGKQLGITKKGSDGSFNTVIDPKSNEFTEVSASDEALSSFNSNVYGKPNVKDAIEQSNIEEQTQFFEKEQKRIDNAAFVTNEFDKPKSLAYRTGKQVDNYERPDFMIDYSGNAAKRGKKSEIFAYPLDIDPLQDHMKIVRYAYRRPTINQSKSGRNEKNAFLGKLNIAGDSVRGSNQLGSILLPMPKATDVNGVEWGKSELTISGLAALGTAAGTAAGMRLLTPMGPGFIGKTRKERTLDAIAGRQMKNKAFGFDAVGLGQATVAENLAKLAGNQVDTDTFLARTGGRVLNPNAEMLFQGPVIRDFAFSFLMIARSQDEGDEIRKIIRFLKLGMAPKFQSTTFLKTPDIFTLEYKNGPKDKNQLKTVNRFNPGGLALTTMNVDYAPNGYWSAYRDSQPVAVKMDLSFTELRPIFAGDQEKTPEDSVGY